MCELERRGFLGLGLESALSAVGSRRNSVSGVGVAEAWRARSIASYPLRVILSAVSGGYVTI